MNEWIGYGLSFLAGLVLASLAALLFGRAGRGRQDESEHQRTMLLRGAYRILEEDYTRAADLFSEIARSQSDTTDTYFVLGRLFRKMGQFSRAERIHQSLVIRHDDNDGKIRVRAMFELGEDYRAAGKVEAAIATYEELVDSAPNWQEARENLVDLTESCGKWDSAVRNLLSLEKMSGQRQSDRLAHQVAEQAMQLIAEGEYKEARAKLKTALKRRPKMTHLSVAYCRLHAAHKRFKPAFNALKEALENQPDAAPILFAELYDLCTQFDHMDRFDDFILDMLDSDAPLLQSTRIYRAIRQKDAGDPMRARELLRELIEEGVTDPRIEREALSLQLDYEQAGSAFWHCKHCGRQEKEIRWLCPSCAAWGSFYSPLGDQGVSSKEQ